MSIQMNHRKSGFVGLLLLAACSLSGGCTYLTQVREDVPPVAVPAMVEAQTLNPDASRNRKVVAGLDGRAGQAVVTGYTKTFEAKRPTSAQDAYVGGTASGASTN